MWNAFVHLDDILSLSLLWNKPMALLCLPFIESATRSYVERKDKCECDL